MNRCVGREAFLRASLTVEAAMALPVIIFASVLLMIPFRVMNASRKMQGICESVCADVCKYAYTADAIENGTINIGDEEAAEETGSAAADSAKADVSADRNRFIELAGSGALGMYAAQKAEEAADDPNLQVINFLETGCMTENEMVTVRLDYEYRLPFSAFGIPPIVQSVVSSKRVWIGDKEAGEGETESAGDDDIWVYVGKTSTRYHLSPTCHYLSNDLSSCSFSDISSKVNRSGHRYNACARCAKGAASGTVYIMPNGTSYHADPHCSAITAYAKKVKKSTVEHLGACSYCGKE